MIYLSTKIIVVNITDRKLMTLNFFQKRVDRVAPRFLKSFSVTWMLWGLFISELTLFVYITEPFAFV